MEKRKLLLVAISAGIFLVIAIGAAIVFTPQEPAVTPTAVVIYPAPGGAAINVTPPAPHAWQPPPVIIHPAPVDPVELVRIPVDGLGLQPPSAGVGQPGEFVAAEPAAPRVITVPRPTAAAIPAAPATPPPTAPAPAPAPVAARPAPPPAARPAPPPAAAQPAPPRPAPVSVQNDYWVQAGSFSTLANAEKARDALTHLGITSIIENRTVGNANWFRVRVGPYPSQDEADYWRYLIRAISGFEQSMVWQTARR